MFDTVSKINVEKMARLNKSAHGRRIIQQHNGRNYFERKARETAELVRRNPIKTTTTSLLALGLGASIVGGEGLEMFLPGFGEDNMTTAMMDVNPYSPAGLGLNFGYSGGEDSITSNLLPSYGLDQVRY